MSAFWEQGEEKGAITTTSEGKFSFSTPTHTGSFWLDFATAQQAIMARTYIHGAVSIVVTQIDFVSGAEIVPEMQIFIPVSHDFKSIYFGAAIQNGPTLVVPYETIAFNQIRLPEIK